MIQKLFNDFTVSFLLKDDKIWILGSQICKILGLTQPRDIYQRLSENEKMALKANVGNTDIGADGGKAPIWVSETGIYKLIFQSRKPEAIKFQNWLAEEVIPSIRKTGSYNISVPQTYAEALLEAGRLAKEKEELQLQIEADKPKLNHYYDVMDSKGNLTIAETAKILFERGNKSIGQNRLFNVLRESKIFQTDNVPYQKYVQMGIFKLVQTPYTITHKDGREEKCNSVKTLVTPKGVEYLSKLLFNKGERDND